MLFRIIGYICPEVFRDGAERHQRTLLINGGCHIKILRIQEYGFLTG